MKKLFSLLMAVMLTSAIAFAQNRTVSGVVMSAADDEPLAGATVQPVGGGVGVATDLDGKFTLSVPAKVKKLTVSYIGMASQTIDAEGTNLVVKLQNSANNLDEVMVVAYGTAKKSAYTGSASVVKADEIEQAMVTDAVNALKGKAAGVQILNTSGQPGSSPTVLIRGVGSINASTSPLYVVDGMPYDGEIAAINTMDIESLTVLKDAAAAALYGARGANGVILITTKRGQEGQAKVTLDARWGSNSRQIPNYNVIKSPDQYMEMTYASLVNGYTNAYGQMGAHQIANAAMTTGSESISSAFGAGYQFYTVPAGQDLIGTNGKLNPNAVLGYNNGSNYYIPDDWEKGSFSNGLRQEYNLSINGGTDRFSYYMSGGYLKDEGIIVHSDYERFSARAAADYQAKKWLKVGTNIAFNHVTTNSPGDQATSNSGSNVAVMANTIAPIYPMYVRNAQGEVLYDQVYGYPIYDYGDGKYCRGVRNFFSRNNAVSDLIYSVEQYLYDVFNGTWYATINPITNLNITGQINYFTDNTRAHGLSSNKYGQMAEYGGSATQSFSFTRALNLQAIVNYRHSLYDVHNLDYMIGYESHDRYDESASASGYNLYNPTNWAVSNTLNDNRRKGSGSAGSYATRGIFGRINYDYDGKYFGSVSYRRDASSRFAPNRRWGNFFSVSAGWDMKKETFLQDYNNVDMIKVKASFGQQGNDGIGNYYAYLDQYSITGQDSWSDGLLGYKGNPDITWETSNNVNAGVDFSFFQGKIDGTVEYFQRQTSDMLYNKPVAPSNGYDKIPMNIGSMKNYGLEAELNFRPFNSKDLTWEINLNVTWVRNKVLKLSPDLNGKYINGIRGYREGDSQFQYYLVKYAGVNPENGRPLFWSLEVDGYQPLLDDNGNVMLDEEGNPMNDTTKPIYGKEYKTENYDEAYACNRQYSGNTLPPIYGGFGTSLNWKGFDFSIQFAYQLGGRIWDSGYGNLISTARTTFGTNWHVDVLNAWTPENRNTDIPQLNSLAPYDLNNTNTDFLLTSSNYLSLNNCTIGYTLPKNWTKKFFCESIRVYAAGDNLWLWSARKGLDPRQGYMGVSSNTSYSAIRNISGGLRVVF